MKLCYGFHLVKSETAKSMTYRFVFVFRVNLRLLFAEIFVLQEYYEKSINAGEIDEVSTAENKVSRII
jgi:hypothetical protein